MIEKTSWLPLLTIQPENSVYRDPILLSGLMFGLRNILPSLKLGQVVSFTNDVYTISFTTSNDLMTVLATDKYSEIENWASLLRRIHQGGDAAFQHHKTLGEAAQANYLKEYEAEAQALIRENCQRLVAHLRETDQKILNEIGEKKHASNKLQDTGLW